MNVQQSVPTAKSEVRGKDLGDEYLIFDRDGDRLHVLNRTAREIFLLCDGSRNAEQLAAQLATKFDVDDTTALADTQRTLDELRRLDLIDG